MFLDGAIVGASCCRSFATSWELPGDKLFISTA